MRYILHADLDAFYASVEQLDNPKYRGLPLVVGGSPSERGVVAAASYEAREYGIRSAMPMSRAFRLHPNVIRVPPRFDRYKEISGKVMTVFHKLTHLVEPLSLDEAYLDISRQVPKDLIEEVARGIRINVREKIGLTITVGGGTSKTVAKIASQLAKPDGLLLVRVGEERHFLDPLSVAMIWGVGPKTAGVLKRYGVATIGDLGNKERSWVVKILGKRGHELRERALGRDQDKVEPLRDTKSISSEITLSTDIGDPNFLESKLNELSIQVSDRLRNEGLKGKTVTVKLRLSDFNTFTRQLTLRSLTDDPDRIFKSSKELFRRELKEGIEFRLIGVGVSGFKDSGQLELFDLESNRC